MANDLSAPGPFAPYVKSITENDPIMKRVPFPHMDIGANPTSMPGNVMIQQEIESMLGNGDPFTVLYLDLDNIKAYNDVYGFDRGDEVLVFTAELLQEAFPPQPIADPFIGHIGGDDFVVVIPTACPDARLHALLDDFDRRIRRHYSEVHRQQGQIEAVNRRGEVEQFPFISLSIAVITAENGPFENYHEVAKRATEVKKACKMTRGSCAVRDRRRDQPDLGG